MQIDPLAIMKGPRRHADFQMRTCPPRDQQFFSLHAGNARRWAKFTLLVQQLPARQEKSGLISWKCLLNSFGMRRRAMGSFEFTQSPYVLVHKRVLNPNKFNFPKPRMVWNSREMKWFNMCSSGHHLKCKIKITVRQAAFNLARFVWHQHFFSFWRVLSEK